MTDSEKASEIGSTQTEADASSKPETASTAENTDKASNAEPPKTDVQEDQPRSEKRVSNDVTNQIQIEKNDTGDEGVTLQSPENIFGDIRGELGPVVDISSCSSGEEEEEFSDFASYLAAFGIKEKKEPIDRAACEAEYAEAKEHNQCLRRKNGLLNKKISEYYFKRKVLRVFDEVKLSLYDSMLEKYEQRICDLHELKTKTNREMEAVDNEIKDMVNLRDDQREELVKSFSGMQRREADVMRGLIDSNTGKVISDKIIEKLLLRQKTKSEKISDIRLAYIKRRDKIKSLEQDIKALETVGGTLHLMDFEQLRMENQTFSDKIEERDDELMRLRDRYSHAIQSNAHIREKINIIEGQIGNMQEKLFSAEEQVNKARQRLNKLKIQRDMYRSAREKLKINTGILTYPKLLMDMEECQNGNEKLRQELDNLLAKYKVNNIKLTNIKNTIEMAERPQARNRNRKTLKGSQRIRHSRRSFKFSVIAK